MTVRIVTAFIALLFCMPVAFAQSTDSSSAEKKTLQTLQIETGRTTNGTVTLSGRDSWQQLLVHGLYADGRTVDVTRRVSFDVNPEFIIKIVSTGLVRPLKEGAARITATLDGKKSQTITIRVTNLIEDLPINFSNQVVPTLTKFGCNSGSCHGKTGGQNGFQLSLLGFEPQADYEYLVKEARGARRLFPAAPDYSLFLRKASGGMAHGGGRLIEKDSAYYQLLRRWIEQGMPYGKSTDPDVTRIEVTPKNRVLAPSREQQLVVVAHFDNGSTMDVTRMTQFESNNPALAEVSSTGLITAGSGVGSAAVMTRYQSHVDVCEILVPLGETVNNLPQPNNFMDDLVFKKLKQLGLPPSELCDDWTFVRRVTIDIAGRLPTAEETLKFVTSKNDNKYEELVDRLLASEDYAYYFAGKWSAVLRNRRKSDKESTRPTFAFHKWIKDSLHQNKPYDQFVSEIITAEGKDTENPAVVWYREVNEVNEQVEDVAQLFLGQHIGCARCHHHPFEKWSQQDYYGMAAFFSQVVVKDLPRPKKKKGMKKAPSKPPLEVLHKVGVAKAVHPKTNAVVKPAGLGSEPLKIVAKSDPRKHLAAWITNKKNPYFAKSLVNRYWKHFFGRGLVEPEDDMRVTNPPSNRELLVALAKFFVDNDYDLKKLVRAICLSNAYRLSSVPNKFNGDDRQNYSHFIARRMPAEVLLDAIDQVSESQTKFKGVKAGTKAVQLPDNQFESYFLSVFGRPEFASACECERSSDATLSQSLHLANSKSIQEKIREGVAKRIAKDKKRTHKEKLEELYLVALSRRPTAQELQVLTAYVNKRANNLQPAYEDIVWAVINTKEFLFNH